MLVDIIALFVRIGAYCEQRFILAVKNRATPQPQSRGKERKQEDGDETKALGRWASWLQRQEHTWMDRAAPRVTPGLVT